MHRFKMWTNGKGRASPAMDGHILPSGPPQELGNPPTGHLTSLGLGEQMGTEQRVRGTDCLAGIANRF